MIELNGTEVLFYMHHANLLIGSKEWGLSRIPAEDRKKGPDALLYDGAHLSIKDARAISYEANMRPTTRAYRSFVIACDMLLPEAQNALLKLLEEPNPQTVFYLIVPREEMLLPTLRSRLSVLDMERRASETSVFDSFKKAGYSDRLKMVSDKLAAEDTEWTTQLLRGLETHAHSTRNAPLMREVLRLEEYLAANGSSKKMLLEHLALTL